MQAGDRRRAQRGREGRAGPGIRRSGLGLRLARPLRRGGALRPRDRHLRGVGDVRRRAMLLNNLGVVAHVRGRWDEALQLYEEAREAFEQVGDRWFATLAISNRGAIFRDRGELDAAAPLFRAALRVARAARSGSRIADSAKSSEACSRAPATSRRHTCCSRRRGRRTSARVTTGRCTHGCSPCRVPRPRGQIEGCPPHSKRGATARRGARRRLRIEGIALPCARMRAPSAGATGGGAKGPRGEPRRRAPERGAIRHRTCARRARRPGTPRA